MSNAEVEKIEVVEMRPKPITEVVKDNLLPINKEEVPYGSLKDPVSENRFYRQSAEAVKMVTDDFESFLNTKPELYKAYQDRTVSLEQHLVVVTQYMWEATGDHADDYSMLGNGEEISNVLNRKLKPKTRCNIFNKAFADLFFAVDTKFSLGFSEKVALVVSPASIVKDYGGRNYVNDFRVLKSTRTIPHLFLSMVTKDQNGLAFTIIDPYHTNIGITEVKDLDFTSVRSDNFIYNLVRYVPEFIDALDFVNKIKSELNQYPVLVRAYFLVDVLFDGNFESDDNHDKVSIDSISSNIDRLEQFIRENPVNYLTPGHIEKLKAEREEKVIRFNKRREVYRALTQFGVEAISEGVKGLEQGEKVFENIAYLTSLFDLLVIKGVKFPNGLMNQVAGVINRISIDREILTEKLTKEDRRLIWQRVITDDLYIPPNLSDSELNDWIRIKLSLLGIAKSTQLSNPDRKYVGFKSKLEESKDPKAKVLLKLMWGE